MATRTVTGFIKSVEYVEIDLPGTSAVSANLTKGQDTDNCVPFATFWADTTSSYGSGMLADIYFESGPKVSAERTYTAGTLRLGIFVVEFDPSAVKVQQIIVDVTTGYGHSVGISPVKRYKSAAVTYFKPYSGTNNSYTMQCMITWFGGLSGDYYTNVQYYRHTNTTLFYGHTYIFEALNDEFSVQELGSIPSEPVTYPYDYTITEVDMSRTMVVASYRVNYFSYRKDYGAASVWLLNSTTVRMDKETGTEFVAPRIFVIEFKEGSDVSVQRGYLNWTGTTDLIDYGITTVDTDRAIAWTPITAGRNYGTGSSTADAPSAFQRLKFISGGTQIRGRREDANETTRGTFEVIEFPEPITYYCEGTVRVDETLTSGIDVRLYSRDDGAFVSEDTTTVSGTFSLPTPYYGEHFAIAMAPASGTNSLIYDWIHPTISG